MTTAAMRTTPITADDIDDVAAFLHEHLNNRVPAAAWRRLLTPPWGASGPNRGFQLRTSDGLVVGAYAAVYSRRPTPEGDQQICNLAAFCVQEEHRAAGLKLMMTMLAQKGYTFTDLSPSGNVIALNERLGFARVDSPIRLSLHAPAPSSRSRRVTESRAEMAATLRGDDLRLYVDHAEAAAARHILITRGEEYAYLIVRRERRKRLPVFAMPLYAGGSIRLLQDSWAQVGWYLLRHHRLLATLAEERILGFVPRGLTLKRSRPRMVRGNAHALPDYLYSELAL